MKSPRAFLRMDRHIIAIDIDDVINVGHMNEEKILLVFLQTLSSHLALSFILANLYFTQNKPMFLGFCIISLP